MSYLELTPGVGVIETPEYRPLPYEQADPRELKKVARMQKLSELGTVLGVIGGTLGLILSLRALGLIKSGK